MRWNEDVRCLTQESLANRSPRKIWCSEFERHFSAHKLLCLVFGLDKTKIVRKITRFKLSYPKIDKEHMSRICNTGVEGVKGSGLTPYLLCRLNFDLFLNKDLVEKHAS